ncbi:MAG: OmpA family protein [Caulobacteraceae bacterium]|nr:MAG: OmpA family protein [Caulobacteraceae bacterium]
MAHTRSILGSAFIALVTLAPLAGPAAAQGRWDWDGGRDDDRRAYQLTGGGVALLVPELRETRRGKAFVLRNFDFDHNGRINPREARAANEAFLAEAGVERGRFDWDRRHNDGGYGAGRDGADRGDRFERGRRGDRQWNRDGMRDYRMRDGRYGAVFSLDDVLFQTGSATLRPGAAERLEPLADYLDANPSVRIRIDGFTDSVGSDASNLTLSRNRARAVSGALRTLGVDPGRMQMFGHGEASPVASNGTPDGRRLNRRVEVSLVGQRASSFD